MLTVEQSYKVAHACTPDDYSPYSWDPDNIEIHRWWLVTKIAELIEKIPESEKDYMPDPRKHYDPLLRHALSTGNIEELEMLCYELLGEAG